jgi:glycosyltransferase involved in cell wall biosynthesis
MTGRLPRLLYVGDIQVEDSYQSSIQLYRLLRGYPAGALRVIETRLPESQPERRLPGVDYAMLPLADPLAMRGPLSGVYRLWLTATAATRAAEALRAAGGFAPEAVLTIGSGTGWLVAAEIATELAVPLHLIVHDDWPKAPGIDRALIGWSRSRFARVYRQARSRLCVSPFMIEMFRERYGEDGELLYPVRSGDTSALVEPHVRAIGEHDAIAIAFCGGSGPHVMPGLRTLGRALSNRAARIVVFGPFDEAKRAELRAISSAFEFRGFVAHEIMLAGLRDADVLFVPLTFAPDERQNMAASLPSKLVDYTAAGVPILIQAPADSGAARWAALHQPVAAVVTTDDASTLRRAIETLTADLDDRRRLAERAIAVGADCFAFDKGRAIFEAALQ